MPESLHLLVCSAYHLETEAVIRRKGWTDVEIHTYPTVCMMPKARPQLFDTIEQLRSKYPHFSIVGSCPVVQHLNRNGGPAEPAPGAQVPHSMAQCFYSLAHRELVDGLIAGGAHLISTSWLDHWGQKLHLWGFDQATARDFFRESVQEFALLDSGVAADSQQKLADLGAYLSMPVKRVEVGLDFFEMHLTQIVDHWRWACQEQKYTEEQREVKRNLANYAMMLDLMPALTQNQSEEEAVAQVVNIVQMLFSPRTVQYLHVKNGQVTTSIQGNLPAEEFERFARWAVEDTHEFAWNNQNTGFYLRLTHQQHTVGVLYLADMVFPQYIAHYLNLSLSMASVCGLAVANARILQQLQETEQLTRHEKEISDTLCQVMTELTSQFEQEEMLRRILLSLYRVIPYSDAAIFFVNETNLDFQIGLTHRPDSEMMPYQPAMRSFKMDSDLLANPAQVLTSCKELPNLRQMFNQAEIGAWMGIPLMADGELFGLLSVVSPDTSAYGPKETTLAHSFANAIESAHVFKETSILAATDPLTGLFNRRSLFKLAQKEFEEAVFYERALAVLMLDIDHFKRVNDTYGHDTGDVVLRRVAESCKSKIRDADLLGRYGGEEFILLLPDTPPDGAMLIAERLRREIGDLRVPAELGVIQVMVSVGLASLDDSCASLELLLKRSDRALYLAKQRGRNRVVAWKPNEE